MATTSIEWTDAVWNPLRGCTRVSEGCRNCYAERMAARFSGPGQPYEGLVRSTPQGPSWTGRIQLVEEKLTEPLRWRKPRMVFVNSMSDLFHPEVPFAFIDNVFAVVLAHATLTNMGSTFQVLTKRPERMAAYFASRTADEHLVAWAKAGDGWIIMDDADVFFSEHTAQWKARDIWPLKNLWLGTSVEDQATADERIPHLLEAPAAVRFLSCEPLLGPLELVPYLDPVGGCCGAEICGCLTGWPMEDDGDYASVHWVIVGGESGPGARPMHPDWVRSIRDQCQIANVPFFFKQWGAWEPDGWVHADTKFDKRHTTLNGRGEIISDRAGLTPTNNFTMRRVGKKAAGRLLDGRTWDEFPWRGDSP